MSPFAKGLDLADKHHVNMLSWRNITELLRAAVRSDYPQPPSKPLALYIFSMFIYGQYKQAST